MADGAVSPFYPDAELVASQRGVGDGEGELAELRTEWMKFGKVACGERRRGSRCRWRGAEVRVRAPETDDATGADVQGDEGCLELTELG